MVNRMLSVCMDDTIFPPNSPFKNGNVSLEGDVGPTYWDSTFGVRLLGLLECYGHAFGVLHFFTMIMIDLMTSEN